MDESDRATTVGEVFRACAEPERLALVAGKSGLHRTVRRRTLQRLGVALTGYTEHLVHDRIQMLGRSEAGYLATLKPDARIALLTQIVEVGFPAIVATCGIPPAPEVSTLADRFGFVLLTTPLESVDASQGINEYLSRRLAPRESRHAVLMDLYGVGVLILGKSGIGKSEVALELVEMGHRLVADDLVLLRQEAPDVVMGTGYHLARHHMEIRGLGIINIKDLYGAASVRDRKRVELAVELVEWDPEGHYDRLGLDLNWVELAGVRVEHITLPVRPGRSVRLIIEVAARNQLLRAQGTHSAQAFADRLTQHLSGDAPAEATPEDGAELRRSDVE